MAKKEITSRPGMFGTTNHYDSRGRKVGESRPGLFGTTNHYDANGKKIKQYIEGKYIEDPSVAEELLPTTEGFFFGSVDYDEYYIEDIKHTVDVIKKALETTDFDREMIVYDSSW